MLTLELIVADTLANTPTALAQGPAPTARVEGPSSPGSMQLATEGPRRPRRPPLDPATRELRQTRGILAGGIVFTALCGVGFGLFTAVLVRSGARLTGQSGDRTLAAGGVMLVCTIASIAAVGVGASRLRALKSPGRVAWTGGLGLRF